MFFSHFPIDVAFITVDRYAGFEACHVGRRDGQHDRSITRSLVRSYFE
jgi:hypothetical protein